MARNYWFSNYVRRFDDDGMTLMSLEGANIAWILLSDLLKTRDLAFHLYVAFSLSMLCVNAII